MSINLKDFFKKSGSNIGAVFEYSNESIKLISVQSTENHKIPNNAFDFKKKESLSREDIFSIAKSLGFKSQIYDSARIDNLISSSYPLSTIEIFNDIYQKKTIILHR